MKAQFLALLLLTSIAAAAPSVDRPAIVSLEDSRKASVTSPVEVIDLTLPAEPEEVEIVLAKRFFNTPDALRFSGITSEAWRDKWTVFSEALVTRASKTELGSSSLEAALRSLKMGRNQQTMLWPTHDQVLVLPEQDPKEVEAKQKEADAEYQKALREREEHPDRFIDDTLAIVPVGAYRARYAEGDCWIIVCKWERADDRSDIPLEHVMVWAVDCRSQKVVGYATCD